MSSTIFTPSHRVKLTNVSVVRLKRGGKRFELACYKNKVTDYRSGSCRSLSDVLQIDQIFANVHKGELAKKEDITKAFGPEMKQDDIIKFILKEGEVQVSGQEWEKESQAKSREIASIVAEKCLNPSTRLPYPPSLIERAMLDVGFAVVPNKTAKAQALELISILVKRKEFPIVRARMKVIIDTPMSFRPDIEAVARTLCSEIESIRMEEGSTLQITALVEPGNYKPLSEQVGALTKGKGAVHMISLKE